MMRNKDNIVPTQAHWRALPALRLLGAAIKSKILLLFVAATLVGCDFGTSFGNASAFSTKAATFEIAGHTRITVVEERELSAERVPLQITYSSDGSLLIAATGWGNSLQAWDRNGNQVGDISHNGGQSDLLSQISAIGSQGLVAFPMGQDPQSADYLNIWDVINRRLVVQLPRAPQGVGLSDAFSISPDQRLFAAQATVGMGRNQQKAIQVFDTSSWNRINVIPLPDNPDGAERALTRIQFFPNSHIIIGGGFDGTISSINLDSGKIADLAAPYVKTFADGTQEECMIGTIAVSPSGKQYLAAAGLRHGGRANIAHLTNDYNIMKERQEEIDTWSASLSKLEVFNTSDNSVDTTYPDLGISLIRAAAWDPKERFIAFVDDSHQLVFWQTHAENATTAIINLPDSALSIAFDPSGEHLAVTTNSSVIVFDIRSVAEE